MVTLTEDAFLGGLMTLAQPARGHHRAGLDAVLLAASLPAGTTGRIADLGAGVGAAGLCALVRLDAVSTLLIEREPALADLARRNGAPFGERVEVITADLLAPVREREKAGLVAACVDHVIANPPFHPEGRLRASPDEARANAHMLGEGDHIGWVKAAAHLLRGRGSFTLIIRADDMIAWLKALEGRFGALQLLPLHPRAGTPAIRLMIRGLKDARAPLCLRPGLILHGEDGAFTPAVSAALRHGAALDVFEG